MKKPLIAIFLCLALLPGCGTDQSANHSALYPPPTSGSSVPNTPDDTSNMPNTSQQTASLSYEKYFSEIRRYPSGGSGSQPFKEPEDGCPIWGYTRRDGIFPHVEGNCIYACSYDRATGSNQNQWLIAEVENFQCILADDDWLYGIENGETLFQIGWHGEDRQDLVTDSELIGGIGELNAYLADGQVLFFMSSDENGQTLCRLYIPSRTLDVLATDLPHDAALGSPISNHEAVWYSSNPEFDDLYEALRNDPMSDVSKMEEDGTAQGAAELIGHTSTTLIHYCNSLTGEYDSTLSGGIYYVNPDPPWWAIW